MASLHVGDTAPAFSLPDYQGRIVSLSDYANRSVIVYFYPSALTPGCTTQAVDFTESREDFLDAGLDVIGISPDSPQKLATFRERKELSIELLADEDKQVIDAYGAWGTRTIFGKPIQGILRSTFVIDVDDKGIGTIRVAQYNVRATGHVAKLRKDLGLNA